MPTYDSVGTQNLSLTTIQRRLRLPVPGEILVQKGEKVEAGDVIARCQLPGKIWVADVSQALGIKREDALQYVRQKVGDLVQANDVLAERENRFSRLSRRCQAAVDGRVVAIGRGAILVEAEGTPLELCAPIAGSVTDLVPEQGLVISAVGAMIQGVWGSGGEAAGILRVLVDEPDQPLTAKSFETDNLGDNSTNSDPKPLQILAVGGTIKDTATLEKAVEAQVGGLIVGSVDAGLLPRLEALPCPVLVTEGFGTIAIRTGVFALFQTHEEQSATMATACQSDREGGLPTVFIPQETTEDVETQGLVPRPVQVGARIRGLRAPHQGMAGTILELPAAPQVLDSGIKLPVAEVELDGGGRATIPLANLDFVH